MPTWPSMQTLMSVPAQAKPTREVMAEPMSGPIIWPSEKDDAISGEFEAFSDTDSETHQEVGEGEEDNSDEDDEAELLDQFDENISYRRHSCDDILEAVQAVKLNYSFPFQDSRQASLL